MKMVKKKRNIKFEKGVFAKKYFEKWRLQFVTCLVKINNLCTC